MTDSLESLLNSLDFNEDEYGAPPLPPTKKNQDDDLDELLAALTAPEVGTVAPAANCKSIPLSPANSRVRSSVPVHTAPTKAVDIDDDDFAYIMKQLESHATPGPSSRAQSVAYTPAPPKQEVSPLQLSDPDLDIDSLLSTLDGLSTSGGITPRDSRNSRASPTPTSGSVYSPYQTEKATVNEDDVESLLRKLDGNETITPQYSARNSVNERSSGLQRMLEELEVEATQKGPVNPPPPTVRQNSFNNTPPSMAPYSGSGSQSGLGNCARCGRSIVNQKIETGDRAFHVDCWLCHGCSAPLMTRQYYIFEGQPHCDNCYKNKFCPKCAKCSQPISGEVTTAMGKSWHSHCFSCTHCNRSFTSSFFVGNNGMPYCEQHSRMS